MADQTPSATLHADDHGGMPGPAKIWRLDPPHDFGGYTADYAVVVLVEPQPHMDAEVLVFGCDETGGSVDPTRTLRRKPGSFTLHDYPTTPEAVWGAHQWALASLGGYIVSDGVQS